jgi:uncharacterized membrane protein
MPITALRKLKTYLIRLFKPVEQLAGSLAGQPVERLIFLLIPSVYLLNVTVIHYSLGTFFLQRVDPEYFYMYNGIVVGAGNLSLHFFDHPGTPLHFLVAFSARIIDIFQPGDYMQNFVNDPEKYIHAANLALNILISIILFYSGIFIKKYSKSIFNGLLFQIGPFVSAPLLSLQGRIFADALLIIPLLLTGLMVIRSIYQEPASGGTSKDILIFGLLIGFGTACKLIFFPVILIPLVLLRISFRRRINLVICSLVSFVIFAYPVIFNISDFWHWVSGMATHSGKYGFGEQGFIDFSSIPANFKELILLNRTLIMVSVSSLIVNALFSLNFIKKRFKPDPQIKRAIIAINLALLAVVALILKHYSNYYLIPFTIFAGLLILLTAMLIMSIRDLPASSLYKTISIISFAIVILVIVSFQVKKLRTLTAYSYQRHAQLETERVMITSLVQSGRPIILTGPNRGAPFIEFAQHAGYVMTDNMRGFYTSYLKEKYPDAYFYHTWTDKFESWNDFVDIKQIVEIADSSFYIYIGEDCIKYQQEIEKRIWQRLDENTVTKKVLFRDTKSDEKLIEIIVKN